MVRYLFNEEIEMSHLDKVFDMADASFGCEEDKTQYNPSKEEYYELHKANPWCFCVIQEEEKTVGFATILLCSKKLMNLFLEQKISEDEMVQEIKATVTKNNFETIYVMSAFIEKSHRKKGIISDVLINMINKQTEGSKKVTLFGWVFSEQGLFLGKKLSRETNNDFKYIKKY